MKTVLSFVVAACAAVCVSGCGSSAPQDRIVGKWETGPAGAKIKAEFGKDGKATLTLLGRPVEGTYKLTGDELEWTASGQTRKYKVKVTETELELTGGGSTIKYTRA